jgi:putative peptidoglycan lipid II flippase
MSYFAKDVADKRIDQLDLSIGHAVRFSAVFLVPLSIFCMVMAVPLVQVVFQRGMFTAESTLLTGRAFACFAAGLFPVALVFIVPRVFYALQENKIVLAVAAAGSAVNVLLNYLLMQCMGAAGIALSTSCVYVLSGGMLLYLLKRRLPQLDVRSYAKTVLPILVSSLAAAVSMMMVYGMQIFSVVAGNLALGALVFAGVYAAMLFVVSRKDMLLLLGSIQSMFKTEEPEAGIP